MQFTNEQVWEIVDQLRVPFADQPKVRELLTTVEERSPHAVRRVLDLLERLKEADITAFEAGTADAGLIQAGELKYSEKKRCIAQCTHNALRFQLARAIGYQLPCPISF